MKKNVLFVGIDVDDNSFNVSLISQKSGEYFHFKCKPTIGALCKKLDAFKENCSLKICYESTYLGFSLCRDLRQSGHNCEVIASSLIPDIPSKKVKTDRIDSMKLAQFYMQGLLTTVKMPDKEEEAVRDLIRSRSFIKNQLKSLKTHITSTLKRMNIDYKNETNMSVYWSQHHRVWLDKKVNGLNQSSSLRVNLSCLLSTLRQLEGILQHYELEIEKISEQEKYLPKVKALKAFRGIKVLTAMTVISEIGDIKRFSHPNKLASYLGLDIIEYSSGGKEKKYGITKMGNRRVRTALVESCQSACLSPKISAALARRRVGVDIKHIEIADKCMKRLSKKSYRMNKKEKNGNVIKVALTREMVGFIWESLSLV